MFVFTPEGARWTHFLHILKQLMLYAHPDYCIYSMENMSSGLYLKQLQLELAYSHISCAHLVSITGRLASSRRPQVYRKALVPA